MANVIAAPSRIITTRITVHLIGGPLDGEMEVPELKHFWFFKIRHKSRWVYYYRKDVFKVGGRTKGTRNKKQKQIHGTYLYNRFFATVPESHQDVQMFIAFHKRTYGIEPDSYVITKTGHCPTAAESAAIRAKARETFY